MLCSPKLSMGSQLCLQHLAIFTAAQLLISYEVLVFSQVIILLSAISSTIQANQQTIWSQVGDQMSSSVPSWSVCCNPLDQGMCKSKLLLDGQLNLSALQPGNPNCHCMLEIPSVLQQITETHGIWAVFPAGFWRACDWCDHTASLWTSLLPSSCDLWTSGQISTKFERVDDVTNTARFFSHIMSISDWVERSILLPQFQRKAVKYDYYMLFVSNLWLAHGYILLSRVCNAWLDSVGIFRWQYYSK